LSDAFAVAHDVKLVEVRRREEDGRCSTACYRSGESVELVSLACTLPVDEIYRDPLAGLL